MAEKTWPEGVCVQGPDAPLAHRRLDIPRQVARLQCLTPLLQAPVFYPGEGRNTTNDSRKVTRSGYPRRFTSRLRAGLRLHPGVRHGALRRRRCEWEQPHIFHGAPLSRMMPNGCVGSPELVLLFGLDRGFLIDWRLVLLRCHLEILVEQQAIVPVRIVLESFAPPAAWNNVARSYRSHRAIVPCTNPPIPAGHF
jgi:hypothetical protein